MILYIYKHETSLTLGGLLLSCSNRNRNNKSVVIVVTQLSDIYIVNFEKISCVN